MRKVPSSFECGHEACENLMRLTEKADAPPDFHRQRASQCVGISACLLPRYLLGPARGPPSRYQCARPCDDAEDACGEGLPVVEPRREMVPPCEMIRSRRDPRREMMPGRREIPRW